MLSPEEIRAKLILAKITGVEIAQRIGIDKSQVSCIIRYTQAVIQELYPILGENPFQLTDKEIFELNKKRKMKKER